MTGLFEPCRFCRSFSNAVTFFYAPLSTVVGPATSSELVEPCQTLSRYTNRVRIGEAQRSGHRFDTPESSPLFVINRVPLVGIWSPLPQPDRCGASGRRLFPGWDLRASRIVHACTTCQSFCCLWICLVCVVWMILVVRLCCSRLSTSSLSLTLCTCGRGEFLMCQLCDNSCSLLQFIASLSVPLVTFSSARHSSHARRAYLQRLSSIHHHPLSPP